MFADVPMPSKPGGNFTAFTIIMLLCIICTVLCVYFIFRIMRVKESKAQYLRLQTRDGADAVEPDS